MEPEKNKDDLGRDAGEEDSKDSSNQNDQGKDYTPNQSPGEYQQPSKPVDNFSPPPDESDASGELKMPSEEEMASAAPKESAPKPQTQSTSGEPEDMFAEPRHPEPSSFEAKEQKEQIPPSSPGAGVENVEPEPQPEPTPEPKPRPEPEPQPEEPEQKLNIPPSGKGGGGKWCLVTVLILIFIIGILAGLIFVNEYGYADLGLEKYYGAIKLETLWGGLPADSRAAMADSVKKMSAKKSYTIEGDSTLDLNVNTKEALSENNLKVLGVSTSLKSAYEELLKNGLTLQAKIAIDGKVENSAKYSLDLATDIGSQEESLRFLLGERSALTLAVVRNGSDYYLQSSTLKDVLDGDKEWFKVSVDSGAESSIIKALKASDIVTGGKRIGSDKVNGVSCYSYDLKMSGSNLANFFINENSMLNGIANKTVVGRATVYLGKRDHLIRKIDITITNDTESVGIKNKIVLSLADFGSPQQISIPASDQTVDKKWSEIRDIFTGKTQIGTTVTAGTPEERDEIRKADIKKIADALNAYKVQKGEFPNTGNEVEKTRETNTTLKAALVPQYLETLPIDPVDERYYYGYRSDGKTFEVWSILENKQDTSGEDYQGYWIYKIRS